MSLLKKSVEELVQLVSEKQRAVDELAKQNEDQKKAIASISAFHRVRTRNAGGKLRNYLHHLLGPLRTQVAVYHVSEIRLPRTYLHVK